MKIETYEVEPAETEIEGLANDSEARAICESLGLTGQLSLSDNETETTFPYRRMTAIEQRVFEIHCPIKTELAKYKSDPIPVRVLQVAQHAMSCGVCKEFYVWHPKDARLDPILTGHTQNIYSGEIYLLARWGAVWKEFDQLLAEAKTIWREKRIAQIKKSIFELEGHIKGVDSDADLFFQGESVETYATF